MEHVTRTIMIQIQTKVKEGMSAEEVSKRFNISVGRVKALCPSVKSNAEAETNAETDASDEDWES